MAHLSLHATGLGHALQLLTAGQIGWTVGARTLPLVGLFEVLTSCLLPPAVRTQGMPLSLQLR